MADSDDEDVRKAREAQADLMTRAFDRAAAYTNVIILAGYAGGFTVWGYTREHLTPRTTALVAILLLISVATFVFFETYKMVVNATQFLKMRAALTPELPPAEFLRRIGQFDQNARNYSARRLIPIWVAVMAVCIVTVLFAIAILIFNFVVLIFGAPSASSLP